jgi:hypothetical protein
MAVFLVFVFALDIIASIPMGYKFVLFYFARKEKMCKYVKALCFFLGATIGVLLWSYIIGLIALGFTKDLNYFVNIAVVGSAISIIPCVFGMLRMIGIEKRGCSIKCRKNVFNCPKK